MANNTINIILAEDHELLRDGFASLIEKCPQINLVAEASNGEQLVQLTEKWQPDVVLTDILMPVMDGIEATRQISKKFPDIGIIAYSMFNEEYLLNDMLDAGAIGYLIKNASKEELIAAINSVYKHKTFFCRDTTMKLAKLKATNNENKLTEKEREVILFICWGMSNKEMADKYNLSVRTIEGYREKIMEKIKINKIAPLVVYAIVNKIIFIDANHQVQPFTKTIN